MLNVTQEQGPAYPTIAGVVVSTAQNSAIGSTNLVPNAPPGIYRMSVVVQRTVAGTSGNLVVNAIYTDDVGAETTAVLTIADISTAAASASNRLEFENAAAANINFSVTLGGTQGSLTYQLYIILERLF